MLHFLKQVANGRREMSGQCWEYRAVAWWVGDSGRVASTVSEQVSTVGICCHLRYVIWKKSFLFSRDLVWEYLLAHLQGSRRVSVKGYKEL